MPAGMIAWALRHERLLVGGGLLAVSAASWAYLLSGAGMLHEMDGMLMPMASSVWTPGYAALMLAMWAVMMMAMMLPSAAPMILLYARIAQGKPAPAGSMAPPAMLPAAFTMGYAVIWTAFSAGAVALQFGLEKLAVLSPMMEASNMTFAGLVLATAGLYQWLPLKKTCLRHCRSPLEFILAHWRRGALGAFTMGMQHGLYCLGCCWMLMLLLFVGGVMNMAWIGGLTLYVLIEKLAPAGYWLGRGTGLLLMGWGMATLWTAYQH